MDIRIHEFDNIQYVKVGDLYHVLELLRFKIYDKYDRGEDRRFYQKDGTPGLTHDDAIQIAALCDVMPKVMHRRVHTCETPDEIRKMWDRIIDEFFMDKYVLIQEDEDENGKKEVYFFRKYCPGVMEARLKEEGLSEEEIEKKMEQAIGDPTFTKNRRYAEYFEDYELAEGAQYHINYNYGLDVKVEPAWHFNPNVAKRMKEWLDGYDGEDAGKKEEKEGKGND